MEAPVNEIRKSSLIQADDGQTIKVPVGFEMPGTEVTVTRDGKRLIIEPVEPAPGKPATWAEFLDNLEPVDVDWPDIDAGLLPVEDVDLRK